MNIRFFGSGPQLIAFGCYCLFALPVQAQVLTWNDLSPSLIEPTAVSDPAGTGMEDPLVLPSEPAPNLIENEQQNQLMGMRQCRVATETLAELKPEPLAILIEDGAGMNRSVDGRGTTLINDRYISLLFKLCGTINNDCPAYDSNEFFGSAACYLFNERCGGFADAIPCD